MSVSHFKNFIEANLKGKFVVNLKLKFSCRKTYFTAIAFDKTGILIEGKPELTVVYPLNGITEEQLLEIVIAVEKLSDHPLAAAIVKGAIEKLKKDVPAASNVQAIMGRGIKKQIISS